jgi:hypothetical protein
MSTYLLPRPFAYDTKRFRNNLRIYAAAVIGLAAAGFLMLRMAPGNIAMVYILMISAVFVLVWLLVVPLPHLYTTHTVTGNAVVIRQGLGFNLSIPFDNISSIKEKDISSGPGVRIDRAEGTLFVLATNSGNVRMMLRDPQTVNRGAFDCVVLDVLDPREFISSVRERRKGEALMRKLEETPLGERLEVSGTEAEPPEMEVVEEEPRKKAPPKRRPVPYEEAAATPEAEPPARIVRIPKRRRGEPENR